MYQPHLENILPNPAKMQHIWELLQREPYLPFAQTDALYVKALRELLLWHRDQNPFYAKYLNHYGFKPEDLQGIDDLERLPFLHANYFKTHVVTTAAQEDIALHVTSSGTTGQRSQHHLDHWTNEAVFYISDVSQLAQGYISAQPCNYLVFNFEPFQGLKSGTATTNQKMMKYAPANQVHYALRHNGTSGHDFDAFGVVDRLLQYQAAGLPVRFLGFAAFLNFAMERLQQLGYTSLPLSADSRCLFGGGWKNHADKEIPKAEFYQKIHEFFGIPLENIRDKYGSVEHPISYVECAHHRLHLPTYERVIVRDVQTLKPLNYNEVGFAQLISPIITSMPSHSILMGDLISLHPGSDCPCGIPTPYVTIVGRAGTSKNKSCAIAASELLQR
ncbi:hypothetical protein [Flavobacterium sp. JP2137]|uniref:LuxE/PaaK family acyltransferase n=1 Tax=Flavobacterium sp. JP2137 TaxID=3414510 RepID=UPI003D2FADF2